MPMRRGQSFQDPYASSMVRGPSAGTVDRIVLRAVELALTSSLMAAGCSGSSDPAAPGGAGTSAISSQQAAGTSGGASGTNPLESASGRRRISWVTDASVTQPICSGREWLAFDGLMPAETFDYATLRMRYEYNGNVPADERASSGTPCSGAAGPACATELESKLISADLALGDHCSSRGPCQKFVVTTSGDRVSRYGTREELVALLGAIDTPQEALLLLDYDDYLVRCKDTPSLFPELGPTEVRPVPGGYEILTGHDVSDCPVTVALVVVRVSSDGSVVKMESETLPPGNACVGRRPEGWLGSQCGVGPSALAEHFARMAELEAAAVIAFEVLADELAHHGAPSGLVEQAGAAARDEVRHAARTRELALRFGARVQPPVVRAQSRRSLEAIALDNAVEGCVRETFGAAVGCFQARAARDPQIAQLMAELSHDELQHAALSLDIDAWLDSKLTPAQRSRIAEARASAIAQLARELTSEPDPVLRALAGLPNAASAARIHESLAAELWS
jgi:hypothetical protein